MRVRRDDLLTVQVDGKKGTAVCGLRDVLDPALRQHPASGLESRHRRSRSTSTKAGRKCRRRRPTTTPSRVQWELFLRHVVRDEPFRWNLLDGAKGVQLAELGIQSWKERRWVDVEELS